jgi:branched-chain amino acid transport system substrate-binding protein
VRETAVIVAAVLALVGCGGSEASEDGTERLLVYVNAPFSGTPYVGETIAQGAELGAATVNDLGLQIGGKRYALEVRRADNRLSPRSAVANVRQAVEDDAVAIVDEGTGVDASWSIAEGVDLPLGIVYQGGDDLVDAKERPNVFRIAPTNHGLAYRLAEYLIPKGLRIALVADDSGYGQAGSDALREAFARNRDSVAVEIELPSSATDVAPQILRARRAGADALLVWAQPPAIAAAITAARTAGWDVPIYTPPAGEDPLIRQQLSDRPEWVDGLTFASGRMTAEAGAGPFFQFARNFEQAFGPQRVGVKTPGGEEVVQPPDYAMYAYDFVRLVGAALQAAGTPRGPKVLAALHRVTITGANGDERSFNADSHEGVIDDDIYFGRFQGMTFEPVEDDPLSASLDRVDQTR